MKEQLILHLTRAYANHNIRVRFLRLENGMHVLRQPGTGFAPTAEPQPGDDHILPHLVSTMERVLPLNLPAGAEGAYSHPITIAELWDQIANLED